MANQLGKGSIAIPSARKHLALDGLLLSDNPGSLNRSMQHWHGVYLLEFQNPTSCVGVD